MHTDVSTKRLIGVCDKIATPASSALEVNKKLELVSMTTLSRYQAVETQDYSKLRNILKFSMTFNI